MLPDEDGAATEIVCVSIGSLAGNWKLGIANSSLFDL